MKNTAEQTHQTSVQSREASLRQYRGQASSEAAQLQGAIVALQGAQGDAHTAHVNETAVLPQELATNRKSFVTAQTEAARPNGELRIANLELPR